MSGDVAAGSSGLCRRCLGDFLRGCSGARGSGAAVGGEIDVYTAPKLRDRITELVGEGVFNIVIDMESVEFLDSTGLGVLVGGLKKVRAHDGSLELICTQDRLLKIFRITGLAKVFVIHDSAEAALASR